MKTSSRLGVTGRALRARSARVVVLIAAVALLISAAPPAMAGAPVSFTFNVYLGGCSVSGHGPNNDSLTVTLKSAEGKAKGSSSASSNGTGYWYMGTCFSQDVESGDTITADDGSVHRTFSVPILSIWGDRTTNKVSGYGPHSAHVSLTLYDCMTFNCNTIKTVSTTTDGTGKFQHDFTPAHDVKGGDYAYVNWTSTHGDVVGEYSYFPYVTIILGQSDFFGYTQPNHVATVSLKSGSTVKGTASGVGGPHGGSFDADFRRTDGSPGLPDPGNKVTPSFGAAFTLTNVTAVGHSATDMVTGTCPANRPFEVYAYDPTYPYRANDYSYTYGTASPTGQVSADTTAAYPLFDLQHGDAVVLSCRFGSGDVEEIRTLVP